jgi:hypothetical protein
LGKSGLSDFVLDEINSLETSEKFRSSEDKSPDYQQRRINPALKPGFEPGAVESSEL